MLGEAQYGFAHQIWAKSDQFVCLETAWPINRPGNNGNSVDHGQKLIRLVEAHNELAH